MLKRKRPWVYCCRQLPNDLHIRSDWYTRNVEGQDKTQQHVYREEWYFKDIFQNLILYKLLLSITVADVHERFSKTVYDATFIKTSSLNSFVENTKH